MKLRLDQLVVQLGLAESREVAQRMIRAGMVRVDGHPKDKPGHLFPDDCNVTAEQPSRFVGRGGEKLLAAIQAFQPDLTDRVCLDIGASTGGFTDCMLQHGARHVYAVDAGHGQLHHRLQNDPRVTLMEKTNARYLTPASFPVQPTFATVDVSFISLDKILPTLKQLVTPGGYLITLIKPQFEAGRDEVGKGGVVREEKTRQQVVDRIREFGTRQEGLNWLGCIQSPLKGPAGNIEYLAYWQTPLIK